MLPLHPLFLGFLVALGIGLLIGIDPERKKGEGVARHAAATLKVRARAMGRSSWSGSGIVV